MLARVGESKESMKVESRTTRERVRFLNWIRDRFLLRFHMTFILLGTFFIGLLTTKILLEVDFDTLWLRYLIAVTVAYGAFVLFIKLWLYYLGWCARRERENDLLDLSPDLAEGLCEIGDLYASNASYGADEGGSFGGEGATESWGSPDAPVALAETGGSGSGAGGGGGSGGGFDLDLDGAIWIVIAVVVLLSALFIAMYLVWIAPAILAEAAFEAALASALLRRAKKVDSLGWVQSVVRMTIWPFLGVLLFSVVVGWAAQRHCPEATKLLEAVSCEGAAGE